MTDIRKFKLSESFVNEYRDRKPEWGPVGEFTYLRTYARNIEEEGDRKENWWETIRRVVEGCFNIQKEHCHSLKLPWDDRKAQRSAKIMFEKMFSFKFLPPGRGLWMMGTDFVKERGSSCLNNCAFITTKNIDTVYNFPFVWAMDALMLGVGVGFDTKGAGKIIIKNPKENKNNKTFVIPDSREGWIESVGLLLNSYFLGHLSYNFDYSKIREKGKPIRGFGGKASGPEPLMKFHNDIVSFLDEKIGESIKSTDIVDIMDMIGALVVSGNIRRSALISLGNVDDEEFVTMKDYNKHPKEVASHRWASNNSVFADVGKTDYNKISKSISLNGEPGIVWLKNMQKYSRLKDQIDWKDKNAVGTNPCGEQTLESTELCCLVESFPSRHESFKEYKNTLKYAYLYAKTVTLLPTHWPETNAVMMKNRRIGLSQSGIIDSFVRHGRREMLNWCDQGYDYIRDLDKIYSDWLCIPRSIKMTSVKPSGTVSLLPGVSPGIHYPHAEYYIRRVRLAEGDPLVKIMSKSGYDLEKDKKSKGTLIVSFPIHEKYFDRKKDDVSIWEQFKNCTDYQTYWADNNVSITVTFKRDRIIKDDKGNEVLIKGEEDDISHALSAYEDKLKAVSLLPLSEHGYEQAPYEEITKEKYEEMSKNLKPIDFSKLTTKPKGERFCDGDTCMLK